MALKVLIVEDEPGISQLLQMYLEKEGYETVTAADGGTGLSLFQSEQPGLVLLDIMLPVMDGWAVQAHPGELQDAHHHDDRQGRDHGQGQRPGDGGG